MAGKIKLGTKLRNVNTSSLEKGAGGEATKGVAVNKKLMTNHPYRCHHWGHGNSPGATSCLQTVPMEHRRKVNDSNGCSR